jgi:ankyrin repeat protein
MYLEFTKRWLVVALGSVLALGGFSQCQIGILAKNLNLKRDKGCPPPGYEGLSNLPIVEAMQKGNLEQARNILHAGAKLNVSDCDGNVPLFQAIRDGYTDFVEELLSSGADPKFTSISADTSLMTAAWNNNSKISKKLLALGVPVDARNHGGETALIYASQTGLDGKMVKLLLDAGADPNAETEDKATALMSAAMSGNVLVIEQLLKAGADPAVHDKFGHTAADDACGRGDQGHGQACAQLQEALKKK